MARSLKHCVVWVMFLSMLMAMDWVSSRPMYSATDATIPTLHLRSLLQSGGDGSKSPSFDNNHQSSPGSNHQSGPGSNNNQDGSGSNNQDSGFGSGSKSPPPDGHGSGSDSKSPPPGDHGSDFGSKSPPPDGHGSGSDSKSPPPGDHGSDSGSKSPPPDNHESGGSGSKSPPESPTSPPPTTPSPSPHPPTPTPPSSTPSTPPPTLTSPPPPTPSSPLPPPSTPSSPSPPFKPPTPPISPTPPSPTPTTPPPTTSTPPPPPPFLLPPSSPSPSPPTTTPASPYPPPSIPSSHPPPHSSPTPPLLPPSPPLPPSTSPRKAKCKNKNYPQCYDMELVCPSTCPGGCEVDCVTCRPVCKCDMPGAVCQDPRFIGGDGITFYFHGKKDRDFCLVTDSNIHINGHFIGKRNQNMTRDFTWVQSIAILFDTHKLFVGARKTATWDDSVDRLALAFDGEPIFLLDNGGARWRSKAAPSVSVTRVGDTNSVTVEVEGNFKITAKVVPITEEDSRVHKYGVTKDDCFAHLDLGFKFFDLSDGVGGVLGQTYRRNYVSRVKMGVSMPVMGGEREFTSSSLFAVDCSVAQFRGGEYFESKASSSMGLEMASLSCGSGMGGEGVVCKR